MEHHRNTDDACRSDYCKTEIRLKTTWAVTLNQSKKADEIHVYIPKNYKRFPNHEFSTPSVPEGVLVKIVEEDYGPATKILPCAKLYRGTQTRIVYCDDDRFADWSWLESLSNAAIKRKNDVIVSSGMQLEKYGVECKKPNFQPRAVDRVIKNDAVYRYARLQQKFFEIIKRKKLPKLNRSYYERSGYVDIAMGVGGVSVNPSFFDDACYDIPDVLWTVDDIWLSASYARQGIGIWADEIVKMPTGTAASNIADLASSIIEGKGRNAADQYAISYIQETFDVWK